MTDTSGETPSFEQEEGDIPERMTEIQVSQFLGRTLRQVHRYIAEGRLVNLAAPGKRKKFARAQVQELASSLISERALIPREPQLAENDQAIEKQIRADAVVSIMAGATSHAEEFFKISVKALDTTNETLRKHVSDLQSFHAREYRRLTDRITTLENERSEYLETLDKLRSDADEKAERRELRKWARDWGENEAWPLIKMHFLGAKSGPEAKTMQASEQCKFLRTLFGKLPPAVRATVEALLDSAQRDALTAIVDENVDDPDMIAVLQAGVTREQLTALEPLLRQMPDGMKIVLLSILSGSKKKEE